MFTVARSGKFVGVVATVVVVGAGLVDAEIVGCGFGVVDDRELEHATPNALSTATAMHVLARDIGAG